MGQFVEIMDLEEFGHALFIDHEIQVAEKDEKIYSSNFFKSSYDLSKKNNNVAIIGGGDGGVARACLENNSNYIENQAHSIVSYNNIDNSILITRGTLQTLDMSQPSKKKRPVLRSHNTQNKILINNQPIDSYNSFDASSNLKQVATLSNKEILKTRE